MHKYLYIKYPYADSPIHSLIRKYQEDDREIADYTSVRGSCIYLSNALQILQNLFIINMEAGRIKTYFGLKLVILGENSSSRQCQKVSRNSGGIQEVFSTSPEFGRKAEIREALGTLNM